MSGRKKNGVKGKLASARSPKSKIAVKKRKIAVSAGGNEIAQERGDAKTLEALRSGPTEGSPEVQSIKIFQIWYEPLQRELIDPEFIPLDNRGPPTEFLEFDLFNRLYLSDEVKDAALWGALSWRFTEKTGLNGAELLRIITENPGHDVYFCNPYPKHEALFHNLWVQGETSHPQFLKLARAFLEAAGLPAEDTDLLWPSSIYSSANYFVGTPTFWGQYLKFVGAAIRQAEKTLPQDVKDQLYSKAADDRNLHGGSSYMPFIIERLFPLFLRKGGKGLKAFKLPLSVPEEEMDVHLKLLRQMKDVAQNTKSPWLAACWANYRSLYFTQLHGQEWTRKYLRSVTPTDFKFA